jgi:septal ring factor EnvC (AmiA/AmiB activator)
VTAAVVALAVALAAAVAGLITFGLKLRDAGAQNQKLEVELVGEQRRGDKLQGERDELVRQVAELHVEGHELERRLAAAEAARNKATEKEASDAADSIRNARDAAAAVDEFNRVLQGAQLPVSGEIDTAGAGGRGNGGATAVQPADGSSATADPVRRP